MRLHRGYNYPIDYILFDLPSIQGWLLWSYDYMEDPVHKFGGLAMIKSPISRECDRLVDEIKKYNGMS